MTDDRNRVPAGVPTGGQFAASVRAEADVLLTPQSSDRPLTAAEFGTATQKAAELRMMELGGIVGLPDGSGVEIFADDADDAVVADIVEKGVYVRTFPDGTTNVAVFEDPAERSSITDAIVFDAVRARRDQAAAGSDALPDPWADSIDETLVEAHAAEETAGSEPGTTRNGVRTDADGKRYVDDPDSFWHGTEIIHSYTRSQALADGVLKDRLDDGTDLNQMAREAGIPVDVAFTSAAFADSVAWGEKNAAHQDESGRAWDVLCMANRPIRAHAAKTGGSLRVGDRIPFNFIRVPNTPRAQVPRQQTLVAVFGTDDNGEPCFTIMKTDED